VYARPAVVRTRIAVFLCPSDPNDRLSRFIPPTYPVCYGVGWADWFTDNIATGVGGNGVFPFVPYPRQFGVQLADITDGLSNTVGAAEVKALGPYLDNSSNHGPNLPPPATPADIVALGGDLSVAGGHAAWALAFCHQTGITFTFPPNTAIWYTNPADGSAYDVDWSGGNSTDYEYAAMTARSYHPGGVNAFVMDGSVRFVSSSIDRAVWRAVGTRNGGEPVGGF
jgi:hypothetical protein